MSKFRPSHAAHEPGHGRRRRARLRGFYLARDAPDRVEPPEAAGPRAEGGRALFVGGRWCRRQRRVRFESVERSSQRRRNRPGPGTDLHDPAVPVVPHHHPAGVACQALRRSRWNARAVLEDGLALMIRVRQAGALRLARATAPCDEVCSGSRPGAKRR